MSGPEAIEAVKAGDTDALRELLAGGAAVDRQDEQGWTALCWAAGKGDVAAVDLLLAHGADPLRAGRDQRTPRRIAQAAGHAATRDRLAEAERQRGVWEDETASRPYCRAYYLRDLAAFPGWPESTPGAAETAGGEGPPVAYLHQDLTVTRSMWHGEDVLFADVTPEWERFCRERLELSIPDDL